MGNRLFQTLSKLSSEQRVQYGLSCKSCEYQSYVELHLAISMMKSRVFLRAVRKTAEFIFERFAKMSDKCEELKSEINNRETN